MLKIQQINSNSMRDTLQHCKHKPWSQSKLDLTPPLFQMIDSCQVQAISRALTFDPLSAVQLDLSLSLRRVRFDHDEGAPRHSAVEFPFGAPGSWECVRGSHGRRAGVPLDRPRAVNKNIGYRGDARQLVAKSSGHRHGPARSVRVCAGLLLDIPEPARASVRWKRLTPSLPIPFLVLCSSLLLSSTSPPSEHSPPSPSLPLTAACRERRRVLGLHSPRVGHVHSPWLWRTRSHTHTRCDAAALFPRGWAGALPPSTFYPYADGSRRQRAGARVPDWLVCGGVEHDSPHPPKTALHPQTHTHTFNPSAVINSPSYPLSLPLSALQVLPSLSALPVFLSLSVSKTASEC